MFRATMHRLTHFLSCREVTLLVSQMQDAPVPVLQRVKLRLHLAICDGCTRFERQVRFLRASMRAYRE